MALQHPVAVHNSVNNVEANLVCHMLNDAGVEAFVTEDVSTVGIWMFGLLPEIHKPQVWIDQSDVERAMPLLEDYEHRLRERREVELQADSPAGATLEVECEECGARSPFPMSAMGSVQECPRCRAYMDIEDGGDTEKWWIEERQDHDAED